MPIRMEMELDTAAVLQEIEGLAERVGGGLGADFAGPAISMEIAAIEREWFETQGGGTWPPLAPSTVRARARRWGYYRKQPAAGVGPTGPILTWSGRLAESLGDPRGRGAPDAFIRMAPTELEQGTLVPYAIYHQRTGLRQPVKELTNVDQARLMAVFESFVGGIDA